MNLSDLYKRHSGQVAFILGAGPSLYDVDVSQLNGVTITINSACLKLPEAMYWLSDDQDTRHWSYFNEVVLPSKTVKLVDVDRLGRYVPTRDDVVKYRHQRWHDWYDIKTGKYFPELASFTDDPLKPLVGTRTSAATAVHVAILMGCQHIVLLGCDCEYRDSKRWFWEYGGYKKPTRLGKDPFPNRYRRDAGGTVVADVHTDEMLTFWRNFATILRGVKNENGKELCVHNCSGGIMDAFPRCALNSVAFTKMGTKTENI